MLGENRYPSYSDLHAYFDKIIAEDQVLKNKGYPSEKCLVSRFIHESQQQMARVAGMEIGKAVYVDPHVITMHTAKPVIKIKYGI